MKLQYDELEDGIRLIKLNGVLDLHGTYSIEIQFVRHCTGENALVLVDLSKVSYISSVGIPMIVNTAKSVVSRGGKFVLFKPQDNVMAVLDLVGVPQVIPVHNDLESAKGDLLAG